LDTLYDARLHIDCHYDVQELVVPDFKKRKHFQTHLRAFLSQM